MLTDYKISRITRHDDGSVEVVARIYGGDITTEDERRGGVTIPVTRYRRSALLREVILRLPELPVGATDAQIRRRLNDELAKDTSRTAIPGQRN